MERIKHAVILARNLKIIRTTAVEHKWEIIRGPQLVWQTPDGYQVRYVTTREQILGYPELRIYFGYGAYDNPELYSLACALINMERAEGVTLKW